MSLMERLEKQKISLQAAEPPEPGRRAEVRPGAPERAPADGYANVKEKIHKEVIDLVNKDTEHSHFRERAALQVEKEILLRRLDQGKLDAQLAAVRPDAAPAAAAEKA